MLWPAPTSAATTITVDTTDGGAENTSGNCSLREAINAANESGPRDACMLGSGTDTIEFDIPGAEPHTIALTGSGLNFISGPVVIDGTTQENYVSTPVVAVDGSALASGSGLELGSGAGGTTIKGLAIHSFPADGIGLSLGSNGNTIQANHIGTDVTGTVDLGNTGNGVSVGTTGNTIGGDGAGEGNLISGNGNDGIQIIAAGSTVEGNLIGTDVTGTVDLGNDQAGVRANEAAVIGGTTAGAGNVISGNGATGVSVGSGDVEVFGNLIGTDAAGTGALGNDSGGVGFSALIAGAEIGGAAAGAGNVIAFNGDRGINTLSNTGVDNAFLGNEVFANGDLGIDLGSDGVTANDADDADVGTNNLQNFPEITDVTTGGTTTVDGELHTDGVSTFYRVELFVQDLADPSGFGEAETFLGGGEIQTDANGDDTFSIGGLGATTPGQVVTATATRLTGSGGDPLSTSELSEAFYLCTVTGSGAGETLSGTGGDDVVCGLGGDDTINASGGDDVLVGGVGDDLVSYLGSPLAVDVDLETGQATSGTKDDALFALEDVTGSPFPDTIAGEAGVANDLDGAGGADTVSYSGAGGFGVDVDLGAGQADDDGAGAIDGLTSFRDVLGSPGIDTLAGAPGQANVLDGNSISNTVSYAEAGPGGVTVDLVAEMTTEDGGGALDTLVGIRNIIGSDFDDVLTGNDQSNSIFAGLGTDLVVGGGGLDGLHGEGGFGDTVDFSALPGAVTLDLDAATMAGATTGAISGFEEHVGTPFGDTFVDIPILYLTYDGGGGSDRIDHSAAPAGVTVDLGAGLTTDDGAGAVDTLVSIEEATGSPHADSLTGEGGVNDLAGGDGADTIRGLAGNDTIQGEAGDDALEGGDGLDTLDAGDGTDMLDGGTDADTLTGGPGNDAALGQAGVDTLHGGDGTDTLTGGAEDDMLNGDAGDDALDGGDGDDTLNGGDGEETLDGGPGADVVNGDGGNDLLLGQDEDDTLNGGEGNDTAEGGTGKDTLLGQAGNDRLKGQAGADTLKGAGGNDTLIGGAGKRDACKPGSGKNKVRSCER